MDKLYIHDIKIATYIGDYSWEKQIKQIVIFNLEIAVNVDKIAETDTLHEAVDYAAVTNYLIQKVQASRYQLIETLAEQMAQALLAKFTLPWLRLEIKKPGSIANAKEVGIIIERSSE